MDPRASCSVSRRTRRAQLASVPGHDLLAAPGKVFDAIGTVLDAVAAGLVALGVLPGPIGAVRAWWSRTAWSDVILASVVLAAIFGALYWTLLSAVYRPWDERERREAVAEVLPSDELRPLASLVRSLAVIATFVIATIILLVR